MSTTADKEASPAQGHGSVNQARDIHVSDHGQVHIGNNDGTTTQSELRQRQNKVLRNLSSVPYEDRKNVNPPRVTGTCKWFLSHPLYQQWRKGTNPMLWVSAEPGCGKSVLSRFLIDEELSTEHGTKTPSDNTVCYFFFKDGIQDQQNLQDALKCILKQLFSQKRILLSHSVLDRFETENHLSSSTLWRLLVQATEKPEAGSIVILLDAVDECGQASRHDLYKLLETYLSIRLGEDSPQVRLFLTSRPSANLRNGLGSLPVIHLEGETAEEVDKIAEEIKMVIENEIELISSRFAISSKQKNSLHSRLLSVENRTYLWAHLTLDLIRKDLLAGRRSILTYRMELPQSVNEAYDSMLTRSHSPILAKRLLQIVLAATRPLSLAETAAVLAWSDGAQRDEMEDTLNEQIYERRVRDLCGLFTIVGGNVSLLHQTVREFLLESAQTSNPAQHQQPLVWRHSISMQQSHHFLAQACIRLLLSNGTDVPEQRKLSSWGQRKLALWSYASLNWNLHARNSEFNDVAAMENLCKVPSQSKINPLWFGHYLDRNAGDQQYPTDSPFTPIQIAAYCGNLSLIHHLLRVNDLDQVVSSCSSTNSTGENSVGLCAVSLAAEQGHSQIIEEILSHFPARLRHLLRYNPLTFRDLEERTPLGTAALHGHARTVSVLLQQGADVHAKDRDGSPPLINAFCSGSKAVVDLLLDQDKSLSIANVDQQLRFLLSRAIRNGKRRAVQGILASERLDLNADFNQNQLGLRYSGSELTGGCAILGRAHQPNTYLALAAYTGEMEIARILLEAGADINYVDHQGMTPLHWAALMNHGEMVVPLIEWGCHVNATNALGLTPMALSRDLDTIYTLLDQGSSLPGLQHWDQRVKDLAMCAVKEYRLPLKVLSWLKPTLRGTSIAIGCVFDGIVMTFAVSNGPGDLLDAIVDNPKSLNSPTALGGWYLIHFAAAFDNAGTGVLKKLLAKGVNPGYMNLAMQTPLEVAAKFGNIQSAVEIMSQATWRPIVRQILLNSRESLIRHSLESGSIPMITLSLNQGADHSDAHKQVVRDIGLVPDYAVMDVLALLLRSGLKPKHRNAILLQILRRSYAIQAFQLLLSHGADPNHRSSSGSTLLHRLADPSEATVPTVELTNLLLRYHADPSLKDSKGLTPLDIAWSHKANLPLITLLKSAVASRPTGTRM